MRVVLITGLSGSGKSTAVKTFEDMGYYVVDNLPVPLLRQFFDTVVLARGDLDKVALVIDARDRGIAKAGGILDTLAEEQGLDVEILFLQASDEVLVRRFSETRHRHPLSPKGNVLEGITKERAALEGLRTRAQEWLDTSRWSSNDLHKELLRRFDPDNQGRRLTLTLTSFGFKYGVPLNADLVFDLRFLANPHFQPELRDKTGRDPEVAAYVLSQPEAKVYLGQIESLLKTSLPAYEREGRGYLNVCLGCTGGQHRSVALAEALAVRLVDLGYEPLLVHREWVHHPKPH